MNGGRNSWRQRTRSCPQCKARFVNLEQHVARNHVDKVAFPVGRPALHPSIGTNPPWQYRPAPNTYRIAENTPQKEAAK